MNDTVIPMLILNALFWTILTIYKVATDNLYIRGRHGHKWYPEEDYDYVTAKVIVIGFGAFFVIVSIIVLIIIW